jgi:RecJ-like exonuclease
MAYYICKTINCEQCNGKGYITDDYDDCSRCGGYGGYKEKFKDGDRSKDELITVIYNIEFIKRICPYLNDAQAINVLAELKYAFNPYQGINVQTVKNTAQNLYFDKANA